MAKPGMKTDSVRQKTAAVFRKMAERTKMKYSAITAKNKKN
jgi:hypothetical protein